MPENLNRVMEALRNADATGNIEDARRLASIADRLRRIPQEKEKPESLGVMPFVNKAIAGTVGAPVDLITGGLNLIPGMDIKEPVGGSKSIERGMGAIGAKVPDREPQTIPEHIGRGIGEVSTMMIPMAKGAQIASKGTGLVGKISQNIVQSIAKHPYVAMTSELTGGAGAGLGRGIGEQEFPDSPVGKSIAEMGGGIVGGMAPTALAMTPTMTVIRGGRALFRKMKLPFSQKGTEYRAGQFTKGLTADPAKAAQEVMQPTIGDLPPAVASGEKRLITLYKSLLGQDPKADAEAVEEISKSIVKLESEMRKMGYGAPEALAEVTQKRIAALELRMDQRVLTAMEKAQSKIEALPVAQRKVAESRIVRSELEGMMRSENAKVQELWKEVPKDLQVGFEKTRQVYASLLADLAESQKVDIPNPLKTSKIVNPKKVETQKAPAGFTTQPKQQPVEKTTTTLKEMQGLRSKLLETARIARKAGQWNRARIADDVADAILDDFDKAPGGAEGVNSLKTALAGTRQFKVRFETGETGRILGYAKSGAPAIDPDLTLDLTIGRSGTRGSIDVEKIVATPEAVKATERYIGRSFVDHATDKNGMLNPTKAQEWVKTNEAILDKFPELRSQFTDAATAQDFANRTKATMDARKAALKNPKISTAAKFVNAADMNVEIESIFKAKNPVRMTQELIRKAQNDATGESIEGLRAGFVDHILEKSHIGPYDDLGQKTLSGRTLLGFVNENKDVINQVFNPEQVSRMRRIGSELAKIEAFENAQARDPKIEMKDVTSTALRLISRVQFARLGGFMGKQSMGGSLQMANIYAKEGEALAVKFTLDRAKQLVQDAVLSNDPKLLEALLLPLNKPSTAPFNWRIVNNRMNVWLGGAGKRVFEDMENDE